MSCILLVQLFFASTLHFFQLFLSHPNLSYSLHLTLNGVELLNQLNKICIWSVILFVKVISSEFIDF